jgi:hypothetical protein
MSDHTSPGFRRSRLAWLVTVACALAVFGLGVTIVHFVWPSPFMFALFMTAGQGSLATAMLIYLIVILADLRRRRVL